ncbi:hypothetical protein C8F01DRAFT_1156627 [Mycena amicta]|nr:hypothetical protein C8F01DRAFT_1156627 [Mycena amicta]
MSSVDVFTMQAPTLDNTLGAVFLGVIFSCILFGISTLQMYLYYHFYPSDSSLHKVSVAVLWTLDTLHLALTISAFGNSPALAVVLWQVKLLVAINVIIILIVQSLYAYRVWLLGGYHHGVLGYLVCAVVIAGFAIGIVLAVETYTLDNFPDTSNIAWAIYACFSASTTIDIMLSAAMCFYLRKSKGTERVLNSKISTLMQYTLSCGVFTSACSVACLFSFILMSNNLIFFSLTFILTRLYVNSFMAMLNARARQRRNEGSSFVLSNSSQLHSYSHHLHSGTVNGAYVHRTVSVKRDGDGLGDIAFEGDSKTDVETQSPQSYRSKYDWDMVTPQPTLAADRDPDSRRQHVYAHGW